MTKRAKKSGSSEESKMKIFTFGHAAEDASTPKWKNESEAAKAALIKVIDKKAPGSLSTIMFAGFDCATGQPDCSYFFYATPKDGGRQQTFRVKKNGAGIFEVFKLSVEGPATQVGLIFDKALDNAAFTTPTPTKYVTTVYQQRQKRIGGTKFWDQQNDFTEDSAEEAARKAKAYIASKGWTLIPYA
jgi:hypothetical protein